MEKEFQLDCQRRYWLAHSLLAAICLAAGCQRWRMPEELTALLGEAGLAVIDTRGISFSAGRGLVLSDDVKLNYLVSVVAK